MSAGGVGAQKRVVVVTADWDADGVVSAAQIYYAQAHLGKFPLRARNVRVQALPSGPRSILDRVERFECGEYLVILDIPFTENVREALRIYKSRCPNASILYFDHHEATINNLRLLEDEFGVKGFVGKTPTSIIVMNTLRQLGINLMPRLRNFAEAIYYLESPGKRRFPPGLQPSVPQRVIEMAASISKTLNKNKDEEVWLKFVKWLSNVTPIDDDVIKLEGKSIFESAISKGEEADREMEKAAVDLAMQARQLGFIKFVDARGKWSKPGSSALASAIFKILRSPVAVLISRDDGARLLIIRSGRGEASRIMKVLLERGIVEDIGGHENIAVGRLGEEVTLRKLEEALVRASFDALRRRGDE